MKMKIVLAILLSFASLSSLAEPSPWGIMIRGNQCSKFWAGDECVNYKLPAGWKDLYPSGDYIVYQGKKCQFKTGKEASCCKQLNLQYVPVSLERDLSKPAGEFCKAK